MAEEKKEGTRKSHRNILDKDSGLPIMVNLYVIKYIYYHIKKATCFMEQTKGRKPKAYPIYQNALPISRQRFDRINKGIRFELSLREAEEIRNRFGIGEEYFRKDAPVMFEIEGIYEEDWKGFYLVQYGVAYEGIEEKERKKEKVEQALKGLVCEDWENRFRPSDPLFAICYYFRYGIKKEKSNRAERILQLLKEMDYREWEQSREFLKEAHGILKKHYRYTEAILVADAARKEKRQEKMEQ